MSYQSEDFRTVQCRVSQWFSLQTNEQNVIVKRFDQDDNSHSVRYAAARGLHGTDILNQGDRIGKGAGLVARTSRRSDQVICSINRPAVSALDTPRLKDTCYTCFANAGDTNMGNLKELLTTRNTNGNASENETDEAQTPIKLKLCTGCRVIKFCDRHCQTAAWEVYHKFECPIYAALHPRILPNNVRAVVRLLLQKENNRLPYNLWETINKLESHVDEFRNVKGPRWENLVIMAQGIKEYSRTTQNFPVVLELLCRFMINSFTLMTSWNDPIGLCLHPFLAMMNHSCEPNAYIHFPLVKHVDIKVLPLRKIMKGEEITISYIDNTEPVERRRQQLMDQYFFSCDCPKCVRDKSASTKSLGLANLEKVEAKALRLLEGAEQDTAISNRVEKLRYALFILEDSKEFQRERDPYPRLLHKLILSYIDDQQYNFALAHAAVQHFDIDPKIYEPDFHPLRLTHAFLLVRLMRLVMRAEAWMEQDLDIRQFRINLAWWQRFLLREMQLALNQTCLTDLSIVISKEKAVANRSLYTLSSTAQELDLNSEENLEQAKKGMTRMTDWVYSRLKQWNTK